MMAADCPARNLNRRSPRQLVAARRLVRSVTFGGPSRHLQPNRSIEDYVYLEFLIGEGSAERTKLCQTWAGRADLHQLSALGSRQMLLEPRQGPAPGIGCGLGMIGGARVVEECVTRALIDMNLMGYAMSLQV
jgi:hypothetical protein